MQAAAAKAKQWEWEWKVRGSDCMTEPTVKEAHKPTANMAGREAVERGKRLAGRTRGNCRAHTWGGWRRGARRNMGSLWRAGVNRPALAGGQAPGEEVEGKTRVACPGGLVDWMWERGFDMSGRESS